MGTEQIKWVLKINVSLKKNENTSRETLRVHRVKQNFILKDKSKAYKANVRATAAIPAKEILPGTSIRSAPLVEFELDVVFKGTEGVLDGCGIEVENPEGGATVLDGAAVGPPIGAVEAPLTSDWTVAFN